VAVAPTGSETAASEMFPLPEAVQLPPPPPMQVHVTPVSWAGMVSVTVSTGALDGPAFDATMV
jgi:hypothetical protein